MICDPRVKQVPVSVTKESVIGELRAKEERWFPEGMQKYINDLHVTHSNMESMLQSLREKQEVERICEEHSMNIALLKPLFVNLMKGYSNTDIAQQIGVHRVTVQRYVATLREMKPTEFEKVYQHVLGGTQDELERTHENWQRN